MTEQMNTFLESKDVNINPTDFSLDIKKVLSLRNRVFHGNFAKNNQELKKINSNMPKFSAKFIRLIRNQKDGFDFHLEEKKYLKINNFLSQTRNFGQAQ